MISIIRYMIYFLSFLIISLFKNQSGEDSDLLELDLSDNENRTEPTTTGKQSPVLISTKNQKSSNEKPSIYDAEEAEEDALCEVIALSPGYKNTRETAICLEDDDESLVDDDRGLTGMSKLQLNSASSDQGHHDSNYNKAQNRTESDVSLASFNDTEVIVEPDEDFSIKPLAVHKVPVKKPQAEVANNNNKYQEYIDESLWNDEDEEEAVFAKPAATVKAVSAVDPKHAALHQLGKRYNVSRLGFYLEL